MLHFPEDMRDSKGDLPAYGWPGGYPIVYVTKDGGELCAACANGGNGSRAADKGLDNECPDDTPWIIISYYACGADTDLPTKEEGHKRCSHCNTIIARVED
jgi:hypothetical protein